MNSPFPAPDAAQIPFAMTDPERVPAERYYDEEFYKLECERFWPHVWQMACRLEQIQNVGDWIEYKILDKSVIVARTKSGVKAYHNVCRHRGVKLATGHGNCEVAGFTCPFHGWRWNIDGQNTFLYGKHLFSERQLDKADLALQPCRHEIWGGAVFINFDDDAPSYRESIGEEMAANFEAQGVDNLRAEWCYGTILPSNWKIAMEAFMEGYHVMKTHPQLQEAQPHRYNAMYGHPMDGDAAPKTNQSIRELIRGEIIGMERLSEGMAGMTHAKEVGIAKQFADAELPDDPAAAIPMWYGMILKAMTEQLSARGEKLPDYPKVKMSNPVQPVTYIFPNYFLLPVFTSMSGYRIRPLGPESCLFEIWSLTHFPEGQEPPPVMETIMLPHDSKDFPPIPQQDYSNIPDQQLGLHAGGFKFMRLSKDVEGLVSNYHQIIDGYLKGLPAERLTKAQHRLFGNFDGKVYDLDL